MSSAPTYAHPERTIVNSMPSDVISAQLQHPLLSGLWISATGYFPKIKGHLWRRNQEEADTYLLIYCLDGRGWFCSGGKEWQVAPGDLVVAVAGVAHSYGADAHAPWTIQWVHFHGAEGAHLVALTQAPATGGVINIGLHAALFTSFNDMLNTLDAGYSQHHLMVAAACLRYILCRTAFIVTYSASSRAGQEIDGVIGFMRQHVEERFSLAQLAAKAKMSRSTFTRVFREKTGYPPVEYFLCLKVQRACELLETTDMSISQISRRLGYQDQYYFSRLFKKFMHLSPQRYRQ